MSPPGICSFSGSAFLCLYTYVYTIYSMNSSTRVYEHVHYRYISVAIFLKQTAKISPKDARTTSKAAAHPDQLVSQENRQPIKQLHPLQLASTWPTTNRSA